MKTNLRTVSVFVTLALLLAIVPATEPLNASSNAKATDLDAAHDSLSSWTVPSLDHASMFAIKGSVLSDDSVANGDFEVPDAGRNLTVYYAGQTFGNWTVESGSVDHIAGDYWQAASGSQSVDLSGYSTGTIYQDIPTVPGYAYRLRFAMAGNPEGGPAIKQMEVWWGTTLVDTPSFDMTGHSKWDMGWVYHEYTVVAAATVTRLRFKSLVDGTCGPVLDDITSGPGLTCDWDTLPSPPVLLVHGWGGPDKMSEDEMGFAQLSQWMERDGYVEGCNLFYAAGVHADNSRDKNSEAIQSNLRVIYDSIVSQNPNWRGHFDIISHSYGGLNARFYLESSRYQDDTHYGQYGIHVDNLFTLGSPHGGVDISLREELRPSVQAYVPSELYPGAVYIAWGHVTQPKNLYDFLSAAQLLSQAMEVYNLNHRQPDDVCYRLVGGDFLRQPNVPWPVRIAYLPWLPVPGDIGVSLRSSRQLGINPLLWLFYPNVVYTTNTDMHGYFPKKTGVPVIGQLDLSGLRSYVSPTLTYDGVISPYLGADMNQCRPPQVEMLRAPADIQAEELTAPPVLLASTTITEGQAITGTMPVDWSGQTAFYVSWMSGDVDLALRDPAGVVFTPTVALSDSNADYGKLMMGASGLATYVFTDTLTGEWTYTITAASGPYPIAFDLYANPDNPLVAVAYAPAWQAFGAPAVITASLFYSATPVSTATVEARIARPDDSESSIVLRDDGIAPDAAAEDGIYSGAYTDTTAGGFYHVLVEADGVYDSRVYRRTAQAVFPVASDSVSLGQALADQALDSDQDDLYEGLDVTMEISVTQPGDYAVSAVLQGEGGQYIDLANATLYSSTSALTATLRFAAKAIYDSKLHGPYTVTQVTLLDDANLIKLDEADSVWTTAAYNYQQFRRPPFAVTLPITGPGQYDFGDTCARLSFAGNQTGTLTMASVKLSSTYPTTQTINKPLPRRYDIAGNGTGFTATLSLCYDDFDLTAAGVITESELQLYRYEGGYWQAYPSMVYTGTNTITTVVTRFSTWAIGAPSNNPTVVTLHSGRAASGDVQWLGVLIGVGLLCAGAWWVRRRFEELG